MTTIYKYYNKTGSSITVGSTTVAGYDALIQTSTSTDLDAAADGVRFDKFIDGKLTNLSPFTVPEVSTIKYFTPGTLASVGSAATAGAGATTFITDASTTLTLGIGTTITGGGANKTPAHSNGTNWIYG